MKTLNEQILELIGKELDEVAARPGGVYGSIGFEVVKAHDGTAIEWSVYGGENQHLFHHPSLESAMTEIRRQRDPNHAVEVAKEKLAAAQAEVAAIEAKIQELSQNQTQTV